MNEAITDGGEYRPPPAKINETIQMFAVLGLRVISALDAAKTAKP